MTPSGWTSRTGSLFFFFWEPYSLCNKGWDILRICPKELSVCMRKSLNKTVKLPLNWGRTWNLSYILRLPAPRVSGLNQRTVFRRFQFWSMTDTNTWSLTHGRVQLLLWTALVSAVSVNNSIVHTKTCLPSHTCLCFLSINICSHIVIYGDPTRCEVAVRVI